MLYPELNFNIKQQESYSRVLLLLRYFFGWLYIAIPHYILLFFFGIYISVIRFIAFWIALFSGTYPYFAYESNIQYFHWFYRVNSSLFHLTDEYPTFGTRKISNSLVLDVEYDKIKDIDRLSIIMRSLFGSLYCGVPHGVVLFFRYIIATLMSILAGFIVLFTGKYPQSFFRFIKGTLLWNLRVDLYLLYLIREYPIFSSKE